MKRFRKDVFICCGANTVSLGTGRPEFNPRKPRPGLEHYIAEAGRAVIGQIPSAAMIDEFVIGNFMAARFNRQGNLAGFGPMIDPALEHKPATRVEGACASGGLALYTSIKTVLADAADVVLAMGVEVQNTVKAVYGADILAGAGHYSGQRKSGQAFFFPGQFSHRAGVYMEKYGAEASRLGMAHWYARSIEHARRCPEAQEHFNKDADLVGKGLTPPNPKTFLPHLNLYDCSKVSDCAAALLVCSAEGLERLGIPRSKAARVVGFGQSEADLTRPPADPAALATTRVSASKALEMAGIGLKELGVLELHDCFSITGLLSIEALGLAGPGEGAAYVAAGKTRFDGEMPTNCSGGLCGFGHPTGGSGVRMAVHLMQQVTGQAGPYQVGLPKERPYGLMVSMGGNDITVSAMIIRRAD